MKQNKWGNSKMKGNHDGIMEEWNPRKGEGTRESPATKTTLIQTEKCLILREKGA